MPSEPFCGDGIGGKYIVSISFELLFYVCTLFREISCQINKKHKNPTINRAKPMEFEKFLIDKRITASPSIHGYGEPSLP